MKKCMHKIENWDAFTTLFNLFLSLTDEPICFFIFQWNLPRSTLRAESPSIFLDKSGIVASSFPTYLWKIESTLLAGYLCSYILIGNRVRVKSSGIALGFANARPPGRAKFANAPPPGLTRQMPRSSPGWGGGGGIDWCITKSMSP